MSIRVLSKLLQEKAENEVNEVPTQVQENIQFLKDWLSKQVHIKYRDDDQLLLNFLRGSKFSLQRAKGKIDAFYTIRTIAPEFAQNLDPHLPDLQKILSIGLSLPLSITEEDPAGSRVLIARYQDFDPNEITFCSIIKCATMNFDILLNECDNFIISGTKVVWDLKGMQLKTALQATPVLMRKVVYFYEKAFPVRFKALYVVNMPKFFEQVLNMAIQMVSKKFSERIHILSPDNWDVIYNDIPRSALPNEYGGTAGPLQDNIDKWKKIVESHRERLVNENNYYTDESVRPKDSNSISNEFGIDGSFRKIEID